MEKHEQPRPFYFYFFFFPSLTLSPSALLSHWINIIFPPKPSQPLHGEPPPSTAMPHVQGYRSKHNQRGLSINQQLQACFHALSFEKTRAREALGASVFGLDEVFRRYLPFVERLRTVHAGG